jgi:hypothetical protein
MAMTLIEMMKTETDPVRSGVIETLYTEETLFQYVPWETVQGLALPYTSEVELPGVAFRKLNQAFAESTGVINREVETLKPFGGDSDTDKVLVDAYGNTRRAINDRMYAKAMAVKYVKTMLYGNSPASRAGASYDDPLGFDGLQARCTSGQTLDAGGSTGTDGSSVFAIRFGDGYCQGLQTPQGVDARDLGEIDAKPVYRTRIDQTAGLAVYNGRAVAWIKDIRAATTVLTWQLMDQLVDLIDGEPTVIVMSKRSRQQLKASCLGAGVHLATILDQLGRPIRAWDTVPIIISDAIIDGETNS